MDFDLNNLAIFVGVADAGSFSEAARRMDMPVSTVSRRLADLETELGARLLERSTRNVELTATGAEVLERCRLGLEAFEDVQQLVSCTKKSEVSGTLRLSAPPTASASLMSPLISGFRASYPKVEVNVMVTERMVDPVSEGIDIAIRVGKQNGAALSSKPLVKYRHMLLASPGYVARHGEPTGPEDLENHRLAVFAPWHAEPVWTLKNKGKSKKVRVTPIVAANDYHLITSLALRGDAIVEVPPIACAGHLRTGMLVEVMKPWAFTQTTLSLVHLNRQNMPRLVRLFIDFASGHVPTLLQDVVE